MDEARRSSRAGFAVLGSVIALVALIFSVALLVVGGIVHVRVATVEKRQTTMLDWEEARSVSNVLVGSGRWRVTDVLAPCSNADPEALIELTATRSGTTPMAEVKSATSHLGWAPVGPDDVSSAFAADSSTGRVHVVVEAEGDFATAELDVDEACR